MEYLLILGEILIFMFYGIKTHMINQECILHKLQPKKIQHQKIN